MSKFATAKLAQGAMKCKFFAHFVACRALFSSNMQLNLPPYPLRTRRKSDGSTMVFDRLRKRFVALTPEELVRQHFVEFLIHDKQYPVALMGNEISLTQNGIKRRCDTVVADPHGRPLVIVEYKAPSVAITQRTFDQIVRYNMVLHASYLMVSNGLKHYCCHIDYATGTYAFLSEIPPYPSLTKE